MNGITVALSEDIRSKLGSEAVKEYPSECCGILLGKANEGITTVTEVIPLANSISGDRDRKHYSIDPVKLYETEREYRETGTELIGFYHSHPDAPAIPSFEDVEGMIPGMIYLIAEVRTGKYTGTRGYIKGLESDDLQELPITT